MKRIKLLFFTSTLIFVFLGCASREVPVAVPMEKPLLESIAPIQERPSWEVEWDRILKEAKKEGQVALTTTMDSDTLEAISKVAKEKFGLEVAWITGRGGEIAEKVIRERRAGIYSSDVFMGGSTTGITVLKPVGAFIPMTPLLLFPEVLDANSWFGNQLPFIDRDKILFQFLNYPSVDIAINTNLVKKDDLKSYRDLLSPKWKGKILMDDLTLTGGTMRWAVMIGEYFPELGWAFHKEMARQEPAILRDRRITAEWLARGKYSIFIGGETEPRRMKEIGAPIDFLYPKEGTYGASSAGNLAYFDKAPHPWAAQIFVNWVLSREGQTVITRAVAKQSSRTDVPIDHLTPEKTREYILKAGGAFINPKDEEFVEMQERSLTKIKEIWGPLVGR